MRNKKGEIMKNIQNNSRMNLYFPKREYQYKPQVHDQTPLIIGLGFMSVMLFGLVIILAIVKF